MGGTVTRIRFSAALIAAVQEKGVSTSEHPLRGGSMRGECDVGKERDSNEEVRKTERRSDCLT